MREKFNAQLEELKKKLMDAGVLCEEAIMMAITSFLDRKEENIDRVVEIEREIDDMESDIEKLCISLLLHQSPVASDLRIVSSALKMITDIERISDQASDIATLTQHTIAKEAINAPHITKMAGETIKMVRDAVKAFVERDIELANKVISNDDIVDELFNTVKEEIIMAIKNDSANSEVALDVMMIAKYLERIADHATNIAEWVEFNIMGVHDGHHNK